MKVKEAEEGGEGRGGSTRLEIGDRRVRMQVAVTFLSTLRVDLGAGRYLEASSWCLRGAFARGRKERYEILS